MKPFEITFKLTGWKAVAALVAAIFGFVFWHLNLRAGMEQAIADDLKTQIEISLMRPAMEELQARMDDGTVTEATAERLARVPAVEITDVRPRGLGSRVVVRVEFEMDGEVRESVSPKFFVAKHSYLTGWIVTQETGEISYRLGWL